MFASQIFSPEPSLKTAQPLPALRILPLLDRTLGPPTPTGQYALVLNWDPQNPSFTLEDKSVQSCEFGKHCFSWNDAYVSAHDAIGKITKPYHRKALLRGLTPVPLQLLLTEVQEWSVGIAKTCIGAQYSWQFLGDKSGKFNVVVNEKDCLFQGIHDNR